MNNKIEPHYVDFNTAKLLKEKEWQQRTKMVWLDSLGKQYLREVHLSLELNNAEYDAPEQWQVVEWLRINHGIHAIIDKSRDRNYNGWWFKILEQKIESENPKFIDESVNYFDSRQKAYSAAFDYILKELI